MAHLFHYGAQPAAIVYESLGTNVFGAFEPGWLNLGLWLGEGTIAKIRNETNADTVTNSW